MTPLQHAAYSYALHKLNTIRAACPGIGGDIEASSLRYLLKTGNTDGVAALQAAKTLDNLGDGINAVTPGRIINHRIAAEALRQCHTP